MPRKAKYAVQFVGYSARVIAKEKYGREVDYATLDFVSGATSIHADGSWVMVPKRIDVEPFLKNLPKLANDLEDHLRQRGGELSRKAANQPETTFAASDMISLSCGSSTVSVAAGTEINQFIRQVTKRFTKIEQVLEQAEKIGSSIKRQPYSEYIDEIGKTGISRVEAFGFALFVDGKLIFHPSYQVALVRPITARSDTFEVQPLDSTEALLLNAKSKIAFRSVH